MGNADAHAHSGELPTDAAGECTVCEEQFSIEKESVYRRICNQKYTAAIEKIGKVVMADGDNKIFLNP